MPSAYLQSDEYAAYGLPDGTTPDQVTQASDIVDAYLQRPEGLVWVPDGEGLPCYMAALEPHYQINSSAPVAAGKNVVIPTPFAKLGGIDLNGSVLIFDRANPNVTEACVVSAVDVTNATITLRSVKFNHAANALLEDGLTIIEERSLPAKRSVARFSQFPAVRLIAGQGRYAYGRRSDQIAGMNNEINLLATIQSFGGPPQWVGFDETQASVSVATGEVWIPAGLLLAYYSDVRLYYLAGWPKTNIPSQIKQACANIIKSSNAAGDMGSSYKVQQAGGTRLERFGSSFIDTDTIRMLEPYKARILY